MGSIRIRIVVVRVCFIPAIASAFLCISQKMLFRIRCDHHTTSFAVIQMSMKLALARRGPSSLARHTPKERRWSCTTSSYRSLLRGFGG